MESKSVRNFTVGWDENVTFSWYDYTLFSSMLVLSAGIGVYFGCFGKKQSTAAEYLHGGKVMKVFPISMSLVASHVSGVTLLAVPADVYNFGATYCLACISVVIVCALTGVIFLPVFYKLQLTSTFEYLKLRFDTKIRLLASFLFTLSIIFFLPIVIYIPALAFSQGTGIGIHYITPLVCSVCIFYTTIGGLKAVVWTDTIQFIITTGSVIAVLYVGLKSAGGIGNVFETAWDGNRLDVDFDVDPTKRDTFWGMIIGFTIYWTSHISIHQGCIQKLLSLPTIQDANKSIILFGVGIIIVKATTGLIGLIMYEKYRGCDPFSTGRVQERDQLVPYYIMDVAGAIPGLPGLFIAGVFCTALSTLSANMNSLAGTVYEDFVSKHMPKDVSQKTVSNMLKLIVVVIGITSTSAVFVVERLGSLLPLAISFSSMTLGTLLGLFTLGVLFPKANSKGAFYGSVTSLIFVFWLVGGAQWYKAKGLLKHPTKPISTEFCDFEFTYRNSTFLDESSEVFFMYRISHYYFALIGAAVCMITALPISWMTNKNDLPVHKDLIAPIAHFLLDDHPKAEEYKTIDGALHMIVCNERK